MIDYNLANGATYRYIKSDPLYPFGYGLSYTTFHYRDLRVKDSKNLVNTFNISLSVKNLGKFDADEVSIQTIFICNNLRGFVPICRLQHLKVQE